MGSNLFSPMAIDAIGEVYNISLGSSATAVSNMLARRVDITTPTVSLVSAEDFTLGDLQPAIGVKIDYVAGLTGSNIMLLKRSDVRAIVDILMGSQTADEDFEINDLNLSAICEVMNQMMGAASTALSDFLGRMVNISTPQAFEIQSLEQFVGEYFPVDGTLVVVRFKLNIEDAVESEFMSALSVDLARELLKGFGISGADVGLPEEGAAAPAASEEAAPLSEPPKNDGAVLSQEEIEKLLSASAPAPAPAPQPTPAASAAPSPPPPVPQPAAASQSAAVSQPAPQQQPAPQAAPAPQPAAQQPVAQQSAAMPQMPMMPPMMTPEAMQQMYAQMYPQMPYPPMYYMPPQQAPAPEPKTVKTSKPHMPQLEGRENALNEEQEGNLDLLMSVPVDVAVEIGRTRRRVKDILNYTKGSLVVLDRLAGDRADLYVNGKCIAKGDIVVVDDNFGLRIAEIVAPLELEDISQS